MGSRAKLFLLPVPAKMDLSGENLNREHSTHIYLKKSKVQVPVSASLCSTVLCLQPGPCSTHEVALVRNFQYCPGGQDVSFPLLCIPAIEILAWPFQFPHGRFQIPPTVTQSMRMSTPLEQGLRHITGTSPYGLL